MKVFVSVGTHEQPFQRLLDRCAREFNETRFELQVQFGVGTWTGSGTGSAYFTPSEMVELLDWADIFISQASPGNMFAALDRATWPLVLGRRRAYEEHVDDHQIEFASAAESMGLCTNLEHIESWAMTVSDLASPESLRWLGDRAKTRADESHQRSRAFREAFWADIESVIEPLSRARR